MKLIFIKIVSMLCLVTMLLGVCAISVFAAEVDLAELNDAIANAEALDETKYSIEDWAEILEAVETAREYLASESQEDIDNAAEQLKAAVAAKTPLDFSSIVFLLVVVDNLAEEGCSVETWDALMQAYENAEAKLSSRDQSEIDEAAALLDEAIKALKEPDHTELNDVIDMASELENEGYSIEAWAALTEAIQKAKDTLTSRSQEEIDAASLEVLAAIEGLKAPDYAKLDQAISAAQALVETDYTVENWAVILEAIEITKIAFDSMSQLEIDAAAEALDAVVQTTQKLDRAALVALIGEASAKAEAAHTVESWAIFSRVFASANAKLLSREQSDIDAALTELAEAMGVLALPDYSALKGALDKAKALHEADYTKESWMMLVATVKSATEKLGSRSQIEIDEAKTELDYAVENLMRVEEKQEDNVVSSGCSLSLTSSTAIFATVILLGLGLKEKED